MIAHLPVIEIPHEGVEFDGGAIRQVVPPLRHGKQEDPTSRIGCGVRAGDEVCRQLPEFVRLIFQWSPTHAHCVRHPTKEYATQGFVPELRNIVSGCRPLSRTETQRSATLPLQGRVDRARGAVVGRDADPPAVAQSNRGFWPSPSRSWNPSRYHSAADTWQARP